MEATSRGKVGFGALQGGGTVRVLPGGAVGPVRATMYAATPDTTPRSRRWSDYPSDGGGRAAVDPAGRAGHGGAGGGSADDAAWRRGAPSGTKGVPAGSSGDGREPSERRTSSRDAVKVSVRVRPFTPAELARGEQNVVAVHANSMTVTDPTAFRKGVHDLSPYQRSFFYDFAYNSFDRSAANYASQAQVFDDLGTGMLENAWEGFNCTILAYGQTGTGKSYTMMGTGGVVEGLNEEELGLIPRICRALFRRVAALRREEEERVSSRSGARSDSASVSTFPDGEGETEEKASPPGRAAGKSGTQYPGGESDSEGSADGDNVEHKFGVEVSYCEIYNERVRDLFNPSAGSLRVREHMTTGAYVEDILELPVENYGDVEQLLAIGSKERTTAATQMNELSSRSHALFTVQFRQRVINRVTNAVHEKLSKINLVDLAGSERANTAGVTGERLKEASTINRSLSALGAVIKALSTPGAARGRGSFVPYRNSVLTRLLKESLGGNSRTMMIATVSPAAVNFEQSLSTLQYLERAKEIVNTAVINEDTTDTIVAQLKAEVSELRRQLESATGIAASPARSPGGTARQQHSLLHERAIVARGAASSATMHAARLGPHLMELNQDPALDRLLVYPIGQGEHYITGVEASNDGDEGADDDSVASAFEHPDSSTDLPSHRIRLRGLSVARDHAVLRNLDGHVVVRALPTATVFVNGKAFSEVCTETSSPGDSTTRTVRISDGDRIIVGYEHVFVFRDPVARAVCEGNLQCQEGLSGRPAFVSFASPASPTKAPLLECGHADYAQLTWHFALRELLDRATGMDGHAVKELEEASSAREELVRSLQRKADKDADDLHRLRSELAGMERRVMLTDKRLQTVRRDKDSQLRSQLKALASQKDEEIDKLRGQLKVAEEEGSRRLEETKQNEASQRRALMRKCEEDVAEVKLALTAAESRRTSLETRLAHAEVENSKLERRAREAELARREVEESAAEQRDAAVAEATARIEEQHAVERNEAQRRTAEAVASLDKARGEAARAFEEAQARAKREQDSLARELDEARELAAKKEAGASELEASLRSQLAKSAADLRRVQEQLEEQRAATTSVEATLAKRVESLQRQLDDATQRTREVEEQIGSLQRRHTGELEDIERSVAEQVRRATEAELSASHGSELAALKATVAERDRVIQSLRHDAERAAEAAERERNSIADEAVARLSASVAEAEAELRASLDEEYKRATAAAQAKAREDLQDAQNRLELVEAEMDSLRHQHEDTLQSRSADHVKQLESAREETEAVRRAAEQQQQELRASHEELVQKLTDQHRRQVQELEGSAKEARDQLVRTHSDELAAGEAKFAEQLEAKLSEAAAAHAQQVSQLQRDATAREDELLSHLREERAKYEASSSEATLQHDNELRKLKEEHRHALDDAAAALRASLAAEHKTAMDEMTAQHAAELALRTKDAISERDSTASELGRIRANLAAANGRCEALEAELQKAVAERAAVDEKSAANSASLAEFHKQELAQLAEQHKAALESADEQRRAEVAETRRAVEKELAALAARAADLSKARSEMEQEVAKLRRTMQEEIEEVTRSAQESQQQAAQAAATAREEAVAAAVAAARREADAARAKLDEEHSAYILELTQAHDSALQHERQALREAENRSTVLEERVVEAEARRDDASAEAERAEAALTTALERVSHMEGQLAGDRDRLNSETKALNSQLRALKEGHADDVARLQQECDTRVTAAEAAVQRARDSADAAAEKHKAAVKEVKEKASSDMEALRAEVSSLQARLQSMAKAHESAMAMAKARAEADVASAREEERAAATKGVARVQDVERDRSRLQGRVEDERRRADAAVAALESFREEAAEERRRLSERLRDAEKATEAATAAAEAARSRADRAHDDAAAREKSAAEELERLRQDAREKGEALETAIAKRRADVAQLREAHAAELAQIKKEADARATATTEAHKQQVDELRRRADDESVKFAADVEAIRVEKEREAAEWRAKLAAAESAAKDSLGAAAADAEGLREQLAAMKEEQSAASVAHEEAAASAVAAARAQEAEAAAAKLAAVEQARDELHKQAVAAAAAAGEEMAEMRSAHAAEVAKLKSELKAAEVAHAEATTQWKRKLAAAEAAEEAASGEAKSLSGANSTATEHVAAANSRMQAETERLRVEHRDQLDQLVAAHAAEVMSLRTDAAQLSKAKDDALAAANEAAAQRIAAMEEQHREHREELMAAHAGEVMQLRSAAQTAAEEGAAAQAAATLQVKEAHARVAVAEAARDDAVSRMEQEVSKWSAKLRAALEDHKEREARAEANLAREHSEFEDYRLRTKHVEMKLVQEKEEQVEMRRRMELNLQETSAAAERATQEFAAQFEALQKKHGDEVERLRAERDRAQKNLARQKAAARKMAEEVEEEQQSAEKNERTLRDEMLALKVKVKELRAQNKAAMKSVRETEDQYRQLKLAYDAEVFKARRASLSPSAADRSGASGGAGSADQGLTNLSVSSLTSHASFTDLGAHGGGGAAATVMRLERENGALREELELLRSFHEGAPPQ